MTKRLLLLAGVLMCSVSAQAGTPAVGDVVWAQWKPNAWFHGKIDRPCEFGLHVRFDDNDEGCFPPSLLAVDRAPSGSQLAVGMRVVALWKDGRFYPGTIDAVGQTVRIAFDDHDQLEVTAAQVRPVTPAPKPTGTPKVGSIVWSHWKPNGFYHGKVGATCAHGLQVLFDDGDQGCFAAALMAVDEPVPPGQVVVGARVLARWSDGRFYPATVVSPPAGNAVQVFFDDRTPFTATPVDLRSIGF